MIFRSLCSGIEAASVAWHPLGWRADPVSLAVDSGSTACALARGHPNAMSAATGRGDAWPKNAKRWWRVAAGGQIGSNPS